jgi:ABC-2 type transport system ATP-binding protein
MSTVSPNPHPEPHEEQGRRDLRTEGQPSAAVRVEDLTVELPSRDRPYAAPLRALQGLDLTVPAGQVTALVGANGAGKTTALRTMIGAIAWSTGRLEVLGTEIGAARVAVPSGVAVVPDTPAYPERWTARRVARAQEATGDVDHRRFEDLLTAHRVPVDRPVGTLSRGQLTQLAVAAALARDPRLLILDEPFARLDPLARTDLVDELRALMALGDRTVLLSTHDLEGDVETLCEEFLLLEEPQEASAERGAGSPLIGPVATGGTTRALVALDDAAGAAPGTSLRRPTMNELVTHCLRAAGPTERSNPEERAVTPPAETPRRGEA